MCAALQRTEALDHANRSRNKIVRRGALRTCSSMRCIEGDGQPRRYCPGANRFPQQTVAGRLSQASSPDNVVRQVRVSWRVNDARAPEVSLHKVFSEMGRKAATCSAHQSSYVRPGPPVRRGTVSDT
jgi:hypothetical protein